MDEVGLRVVVVVEGDIDGDSETVGGDEVVVVMTISVAQIGSRSLR